MRREGERPGRKARKEKRGEEREVEKSGVVPLNAVLTLTEVVDIRENSCPHTLLSFWRSLPLLLVASALLRVSFLD